MTVTERIDWQAIDERARNARPGLAVVHGVGFLIWGLFWLVGRAVGYGWLAVAWTASAAVQGYQDGFRDSPWARARQIRAQAVRARVSRG